MLVACKVQLKRDTAANWSSVNPVLSIGEVGIALDTKNFKVGDGVTDWNSLPFYIAGAYTDEMAQDAIGGILTDTGSIDFTYDDTNNQILAYVIPGGVNHDNLLNMSANKHIDHTTVSITGSDGLSGGGDISANRTITLPAVGTAGTYGNASSVAVITTDAKGRVTAVTPTNISITSAAVSDWTEAVQDVMGAILADTNTIDFTYNDAANTLAVDVKTQMSITSDESGLKLVNDASSPGNSMVYGTNASGVRGWYSAGGGGNYYDKSSDIVIANPYKIDFGSTLREDIIFGASAAGDSNWSTVVLLLHMNGVNNSTLFTDASQYSHFGQRFGAPYISTTLSKFGGASGYFDGVDDYVRYNGGSEMAISGDYTIEGWFYSTEPGTRYLCTWGPSPYWALYLGTGNSLNLVINGVHRITGTLQSNQWVHVAVTREANVYRLFNGGTLAGSYTDSTAIGQADFLVGGWTGSSTVFWVGHIDDFRFSNGVARYTANFTPPTSEFPSGAQYFAIGTQDNALYLRSSSCFDWYKNGTYSSVQDDPGSGGTLQMHLSAAGKLYVPNGYRAGSTQGIDTPDTLMEVAGTSSGWLQMNVQNQSNGGSATSDIVATMDTGSDLTGYIDLGINSSGYNDPSFNSGGPGTGYLLVSGGALTLITLDSYSIGFFTGGATTAQTRLMIYPAGNVVMGQGILATNATDGFFYLADFSGQPTGTPTAYTGRTPVGLDSSSNDFYFYTNSAWRTDADQYMGGGFVTGNFYSNDITSPTSTTQAAVANQLTVMPFVTRRDVTCDQIGVNVTATSSGSANIVIYADNPATGWPGTRLAISANIDTHGSAGFKYDNLSFTFRKGVRYWIGVHFSATPTCRTIPATAMQGLGLTSSTGTSQYTVLRQTVAFGSSPNPWSFSSAHLVATDGYSIRFRAA